MYRICSYRNVLVLLFLVPILAQGQEVDYEALLRRVDTVENQVYKPVVSFSYGVLDYFGDVQNSFLSPVIGNSAMAVNLATFVDRKHYFTGNFNFMMGNLSGNSYDHSDLSRNLNFRTSLTSIGVNIEYRFAPFINKGALLRPYLSLGAAVLNFNAKGDLTDGNGLTYYYWQDGSIRDIPESMPGDAEYLYRDYTYETDLRDREHEEFGLGDYSQTAVAFPLTVGSYFRISNRAFFSLGVSYYYALTDMLDNVAYEGTSVQGGKGYDSFFYTHLSLHFDLFSDPATRTVELLYADMEFDESLFDDEDGDFVLDIADRCPGTPYGIEVDSTGCPLDIDMDGVPDYLDEEPYSELGAWVDENGMTITDEEFEKAMSRRENAMPRDEVEEYMTIISGAYRPNTEVSIPEKFQAFDADGDGELSFEELMHAIDQYFDYQPDLDVDEIRQLNDFFFSQ